MISLLFILAVAGLFALIVVTESEPGEQPPRLLPPGLLRWLVSGNWPAKVGAGLLIFGVGALLRYALLRIDVPPTLKLGGGLLISALLAAGAFALRERPGRRAIRLALAGAAGGVAYLTAYSAYGFFGYVNELPAIALLGLVAVATGSFAVSERSMSIAILAMLGAYLAPAFALTDAGPLPVYGYYLLVSLLCLAMVALRGWRGLIHLSFLFTLAGGVFFAWTAQYAQPAYYPVMQPLLLALAAVHLAMPLLERKHLHSRWMDRFDVGYFLVLPLVSALLALLIAPTLKNEGALGLALLGALWALAALLLKVLGRDSAMRHAVVAALLFAAAVLCRIEDVPWILVGLGLVVAAMAAAPRLRWERSTEEMLAGVAVLFGFLHVLFSLFEPAPAQALANSLFAERLLAVAMLAAAAWLARRRGLSLARVLLLFATGWLLLSLADELRRLYVDYVPQLAFGLLLGALFIAALGHRWLRLHVATVTLLTLAMLGCANWAAAHSGAGFALAALLLAPAVMLLQVFARTRGAGDDDAAAFMILLLPLAMLPWVAKVLPWPSAHPAMMTLAFGVFGAAIAWAAAALWQPRREMVQHTFLPMHFWTIAGGLVLVLFVHIERSLPAVLFECAALAYLSLFAVGNDAYGRARPSGYGIVAFIAAFVVLQAMLLRMLGPPQQVMDFSDIGQMRLRAVLSLSWALLGAGLAWWGMHRVSRGTWGLGAGLLVAAAIKLVFFDFGSLGQLGNILALIGAGLVFLMVAWLAPAPPKREPPAAPPPPPSPSPSPRPHSRVEEPIAAPSSASPDAFTSPPSAAAATSAATAPPVHAHEPPPPAEAEAATPPKPVNRAVFALPPETPETPEPAPSTREPASTPPPLPPSAGAARTSASVASTTRISMDAPREPNRLIPRVLAAFGVAFAVVLLLNGLRDLQIEKQRLRSATETTRTLQRSLEWERERERQRSAEVAAAQAADVAAPQDSCAEFARNLALPRNFRVYWVDARGPSAAPQPHKAGRGTTMQVVVDSPLEDVVLLLSSQEPTMWKVRSIRPGSVLGIVASGGGAQELVELPPNLPVMRGSDAAPGACGQFGERAGADAVAQRVTGRSVDREFKAISGKAWVGVDPPRTADAAVGASPPAPLPVLRAEEEGLEDAVRLGLIRNATSADQGLWVSALEQSGYKFNGAPPRLAARPSNIYIVMRRFAFPEGLYGAHAATFIVPPGVPRPQGDRGHSTVYELR